MKRKNIISLTFLLCSICSGAILVAQPTIFQESSLARGITDVADMTNMYGNGAAAADFDQDGDIDFYLTTDKQIPDRLYRNDGKGHFTDVAVASGIVETRANRAALWFDYNGDHLLDLAVVGENCVNWNCLNPIQLTLYQQLPDTTFRDVTAEVGLSIGTTFDSVTFHAIGGIAAGDINGDNYLDLLLTVWGGGIILFQNQGGESFSDVTLTAGLRLGKKTPWQPMFFDVNQDGLQDIYCNIDFVENRLWINRGGRFNEQAAQYGLNTAFSEMGMAISDMDNDGDLDIYMTNITTELQGELQHNVLFEQERVNGLIQFKETSIGQGVSQSGWDWGTTFLDMNNDGLQDLLATNGWWNGFEWDYDRSNAWLNTTAGFVNVSHAVGFNDTLDATALMAFDMDRDGDLDFIQTLKDNPFTQSPLHLYENQLEKRPQAGNFLTVKPRMQGPNHWAIGSVVTLLTDNLTTARLISAGCSFYSQEPAEAHFGLGKRESVQEVIVRWPAGQVSIYTDIPINQTIELSYDFIKAPAQLTASLLEEKVVLNWRDQADTETGYVVHKSKALNFRTYEVIRLDANSTTYTDEEIEPGNTYYYRVRARNEQVFSDNSNVAVIQFGNTEVQSDRIRVFPNPLQNNSLKIDCFSPQRGTVLFEIFDLSGKRIWAESKSKSNDYELYSFPLSLSQGLYLLKMTGPAFNYKQKIIIGD